MTLRRFHLLRLDPFVKFSASRVCVWLHVQSCDFVLTRAQHTFVCFCLCACVLVQVFFFFFCVCSCCMCQKAERQTASVSVSAGCPGDWCARKQSEELLTRERQTGWLLLAFDGQISNSTSVHLTSSFLLHLIWCFSFMTLLKISYLMCVDHRSYGIIWAITITFPHIFLIYSYLVFFVEMWFNLFFTAIKWGFFKKLKYL